MKREVTSVFANVFSLSGDELLDYNYLSVVPGLRRLKPPSVSSSFSWNGQEVASLAGQGSLYIMANTPLPVLIPTMVREIFMIILHVIKLKKANVFKFVTHYDVI